MLNENLKQYIDENILPLYEDNIGGHDINHINYVINRSFELVNEFDLDVDLNMVYVVAAFHDIGYKINPDKHEEVSGEMFKKDKVMEKFFNAKQQKIIEEAIIDHRASLEYEPRSIYGKIVSSADREISVANILKRSILFQYDKHKNEELDLLQLIEYSYKKLSSKYGKNGYAKMYFKDEKYFKFLEEMNMLINDKNKFIFKEVQIIEALNQNENRLILKQIV